MRGYAAVGLHNPKNAINVGSVLRACGNYGAAMLATTGRRYRKAPTDTMSAVKRIPLIRVADLHDAIPYDCVPIAIELAPEARPINELEHPERAFYVFGPEDGTLGAAVRGWCRGTYFIPTDGCMNLAATVAVVLYDRWRQITGGDRWITSTVTTIGSRGATRNSTSARVCGNWQPLPRRIRRADDGGRSASK